MKYCSNCASKVVFRPVENDHLPRFVCDACGIIHYQNPRVIVGCIPVWEDKIILCRRGIEPQLGYWNIPGGFLENHENVEDGAAREAKEEAGLELEITSLQSVFTVAVVHQVHLHFVAKVTCPNWHLTEESTEIQLFSINEIPWETIAFKSNEFALKSYIADIETNKRRTHLGHFDHVKNDYVLFNAIEN